MPKLYILIIILLMSACVQMPTFIPGADKNNSDGSEFGELSTLYVFRSENTLAPGFSFQVVIDEGSMASLMRQQFSAIPIASGSHIINFDCRFPCGATSKPKFKIDVEKGKTYYLHFSQSINNEYFKFMSKDEAELYIKQYQKIPLTPLTSTVKSSKSKKIKRT